MPRAFASRSVPALVLATCVAPAAVAQVWKCTDERAQVIYQDTQCPPGRELADLAHVPSTVSVIPLRPVPGTVTRAQAERPVKSTALRKAQAGGDAAERRHLHVGMHEGEVVAHVGAPDLKSGGGGRKVARWTYLPSPRDPQTLTTVVFEYGKVIEVERKVVR
jgi:hypothetical protein